MSKSSKTNHVFIATSIDGYIADANGGIDWLHATPNPQGLDMGYTEFMKGMDALVMGRKTFETILGFGIDWPYDKPVFVLSNTLRVVPEKLQEKVKLVSGDLNEVLKSIHQKGFHQLYIDGGKTIQSFLKADLIDSMIITQIPILLGGGTRLFAELEKPIDFQCVRTQIWLDRVVQNEFRRLPRD